MKIIIKRNSQSPEYTVDTKDCKYETEVREALRTALELDGHPKGFIDIVFRETSNEDLAGTDVEDFPNLSN